MTAEATLVRGRHDARETVAAATASGEVQQMRDGRAGIYSGLNAAASGDPCAFCTEGQFTVAKTSGVVFIDGAPLYWDHSANSATCVPPMGAAADDRDFFIGVAVGDAASADTSAKVNLNVKPHYAIDIHRDGGDSVIVKTVVGSITVEVPRIFNRGGSVFFGLGTTAEAQKVDWLSKRSFPLGSKWVAAIIAEVVTNGDADVVDVSLGVADETHASDADSITTFCGFHLDPGADLDIMAESDDDTTEVAATDTAVNWAVGTPVLLVLDGRDPDDVLFYVNGVEVLNGTADLGDIGAAVNPLKLLIHAEKSSNDSPFEMAIDHGTVRFAERA